MFKTFIHQSPAKLSPRLFECGKYSDLTLVCGMKRYSVHRALVCSRSEFFEGACRNPFRESETGVIDLTEDDPEAVEHMVNCKHQSSPPMLKSPLTALSRLLPSRLPDKATFPPLITTIAALEVAALATLSRAQEVEEAQSRALRGPSCCHDDVGASL